MFPNIDFDEINIFFFFFKFTVFIILKQFVCHKFSNIMPINLMLQLNLNENY